MKKFFLTGAFAIFSLFAFSQGFMVNFTDFDAEGFDMSGMTDNMEVGTFVNDSWAMGVSMTTDTADVKSTGWFARYYFNDNMYVSFNGSELDLDTDGMNLGFGYTMMVNDWLAIEPTVSGDGIGIDNMDFSLSIGMRF